jgi:RHS repeat-associated protein
VSTKLGEFPTVADTNWHFLRMEVQGNQLRVRTWDNPWIEPTTWNLEVTDNSVTGTGNNQASFTRLGAGPQPARAVALDHITMTNPSAAEPALATYGWDKQGRLTGQTSPDGSRSWHYGDGRLDTYTQNVPDAAFTTDLGYDAAGRIAAETTAGATTSYDYDAAGQLTQVVRPGGTDSYTYDDLGRRQTKSIAGAVTTYDYDDADQLTSTTGAESTTYTWDAAGRMLTSKTGATTTSFTYDPAGQLATEKRGGTTLTRTVNGDGQLTAVTNQSGATTRIDWDTSQPIPEPSLFTTTANQATTLTDTAGTTTAYRQGDTNKALPLDVYGSALKTSASNGLAGAAGYDAFGNPTTTIGFADIRLGYRGELTEANTVHLRNRQYNPATGSFTTRDPLDGVDGTPTVTNPYHYADNDPINKTDPLGLRPGDGSITDGQAGAACDSVGGRLVLWGSTGSKVCMEPPIGRNEGGSCWPPMTPGGDALVYHQGGCGVWNTTIECARGDWIPGANFICQHSEGIIQGLTVIAVVALGVATGGAAVVAVGGSAGIAIPTGGGALAFAGGGTVAGGGAIVLSPAAAGTLVGSVAGIQTLIHMASDGTHGALRGGEGDRDLDANEIRSNADETYFQEDSPGVLRRIFIQHSGSERLVAIYDVGSNVAVTVIRMTAGGVASRVASGRWFNP